MSDRGDEAPGWFFRRGNVSLIWYGLLLACALLAAAELVYVHNPKFEIERIPGFFAIFGFLAFVLIIFAGRLLRTIIMRDEDYYERD